MTNEKPRYSLIIAGRSEEVFRTIRKLSEDASHEGAVIYFGSRLFQMPGHVLVTRTEIGPDLCIKSSEYLDPRPSQAVYNHSPDGFEWGYHGSGPAQLALALLLDVTGDAEIALRYHQDFKASFVAGWGEDWHLRKSEIERWLGLKMSYRAAQEAEAGE